MTLDDVLAPVLRLPLSGLGRRLATMRDLARSRRDLGRLDAARLDDLGIDPADARTEARRPAWDVPATWRR
ncbi:DUF1127 domain-containing protein [Roseivivax isoporae]|uniref:DUF1127 domain-containing protein n=1 Tax=Roseivivax isoporae LMG 25204 TaxID=1449351 RepID=X7F911_9RHOB|nr:DUF1127 domain-containing protein [Roseivivax isoporae]ETX29218.1 hypothetical protein RISW2_02075 [Roseivivax isoporae LMG 25204]